MNSAEITYVIVSRRYLLLILPCAPEQPLATHPPASELIPGLETKFHLFAREPCFYLYSSR